MQSNLTLLGCEIIAILSDHSYRAIGTIAQEMAQDFPGDQLQPQLDRLVADGVVRRHFIGDAWFYQLEVQPWIS
jgi:hypothetical protein